MRRPTPIEQMQGGILFPEDVGEPRDPNDIDGPDVSEGLAQLIEPDGTLNIIVTVQHAIKFTKEHAGWSWQYLQNNS